MGSNRLRMFPVLAMWLGAAALGRAADPPRAPVFPGRVEPSARAGLSARVPGAVDKVLVDVGDRVKKGQVLIELAAPELKDDVDAAAARLEGAKAEIERAEAAVQTVKAKMAQAGATADAARAVVKSAHAQLEQAKVDVDRIRRLVETNAVSQADHDEYEHKVAAAAAALQGAEAQIKTADAARDVVAAELAQAQAGVKAAQAGAAAAEVGVRRAQTRLEYARIVAPFDGLVSARTADEGATIGPAQQGVSAPLVTVVRDDVVHVVFDVDERTAAKRAVGQPASIRRLAYARPEFEGKVTRLSGAVNPDAGTVRVEIDVPNPDGKLRPGAAVEVGLKNDGADK